MFPSQHSGHRQTGEIIDDLSFITEHSPLLKNQQDTEMSGSSLPCLSVGMATASMTEEQITAMLINEQSGGLLTSDRIRPFEHQITPRLCARLLLQICSSNNNTSNPTNTTGGSGPSHQMRFDDIDALANICREFLPSASPLTDIIRAIDSESFIPLSEKVVHYKSHPWQPFHRLYYFCVNLVKTEKQGISILGYLFFNQLWSHNLEFQFGFIVNCINNKLVSKLLSSTSPSSSSGSLLPGQEFTQVVPQLESLKCQPDVETSETVNWKYQKVYQILLDVSVTTSGIHTNQPSLNLSMFYKDVIEVLRWPIQNCPDLVALGILGCSGNVTQPKKELLSSTLNYLLGNHPNSAVILHVIWSHGETAPLLPHGQAQWAKQVLLQSMCDYYIKSSPEEQQSRLSRILDVAQDLKALSLLLNGSCYPFVIDLACLASRREYLKLDKWLMDKIQCNGAEFVSAIVDFLNRRCPALQSGPKEQEQTPLLTLPSETLATMLACLHHIASPSGGNSHLSKELSDAILTMISNSTILLQNRATSLSSLGAGLPNVATLSAIHSRLPLQQQLASQARPSQQIGGAVQNLATSHPTMSHAPQSQSQDVSSLASLANMTISQSRAPFGPQNANLVPNMSILAGLPGQPGSQVGQQQQQQPDQWRQTFGDLARIFPDMPQNVSPEIEKEADIYFQRIYNHSTNGPQSMSIDEVLDMLQRFQDSPHQREKDVYSCMIRNLFKEYCYFPQYPDKELLITAQLFGGIIQKGLVKYMPLVVALRFVLEALRKANTSKMYFFGIAALDRFKSKLKDYPLYCQHLTSIPHFDKFPPHLVEYIKCGAQSSEHPQVPTRSSLPVTATPGTNAAHLPKAPTDMAVPAPNTQPPSTTVAVGRPTGVATTTKTSIASADIATLLAAGASHKTPPEPIQDKVAFIINNLSQMNLQQKTDEFKDVIGKETQFHEWIAQYFVMKRASIELNFHTLYANFLDVLNNKKVNDLIIRETHRNIKVLLRSNKEAENFSDRSLLKNLGHWLGMLTLAKSKPILAIDLDVKKLLIEAYHKGNTELLYVVPFIAKVLESTAKSNIFRPPNPWTMGIVRALVELHQEPTLKLNLKFEVEVLCKTLNQDLHQLVGSSSVLQRPDLREKVLADPQLGPARVQAPQVPIVGGRDGMDVAFQPGRTGIEGDGVESLVPKGKAVASGDLRTNASPPQMQGPVIPSPGVHVFNFLEISTNLVNIGQFITVPTNNALFQHQPNLIKFIRPCIEKGINDWLNLVIERSMKISIVTAERIIKKDFALEADETIMQRAAHNLIRSLSAGMAMITSKEPLFVSMCTHLVSAFGRACPNVPKDALEAAAHSTASENIDLACCFIQKSAVEKATIELDKRLKADYDARRQARMEGRRFCDPVQLSYQMERMPDPIKLSVGSVPHQQLQVYEEIGRSIPGFHPLDLHQLNSTMSHPVVPPQGRSIHASGFTESTGPVVFPQHSHISGQPIPTGQQIQGNPASMDQGLITLYEKLCGELENLFEFGNTSQQPRNLMQTMHTILDTVAMARSNPRDIVSALTLIQKVLDAITDLLITVETGVANLNLEFTTRARDLYLVILKALADPRAYGQQWTTKQITRLILERFLNQQSPQAPLLPDDLFDILMKSNLIHMYLLDTTLAQYIEAAQSPIAFAFTFQFVKIYGPQGIQEHEIPHIVQALMKLAKTAETSQIALQVQQILEAVRSPGEVNSGAPVPAVHRGGMDWEGQESDFQEKTERLLREWIQIFYSPQHDINKFFSAYVQQMNLHGILKTDDSITRFFHHSTELCVNYCWRLLTSVPDSSPAAVVEVRSKCFHTLDAFSHLILMLVKHSGNNSVISAESTAKLNLLNKVLSLIANIALEDQKTRREEFQHLPYYRIFVILFMELMLGSNNLGLPLQQLSSQMPGSVDPIVEQIQFQVLSTFCQTLKHLKPSKCPSFAYAWLDFISHRTFLDKCLNGVVGHSSNKGWPLYAQLLLELIKFLAPFLRCVEMSTPIELLYKGTLKLLLVLLHDFPEFLCDFCHEFCDWIPCNAIQMRNLVLSAFPRNMRLPDPFTPNLKIDNLPEIFIIPKGPQTSLQIMSAAPFKKDLDSYLRTRSPVTFLSELRGHLQLTNQAQAEAGGVGRYNIPLMNALVFYVGHSAIQTITPRHISMSQIAHTSHMDIFQNLAVDLDTEGRYIFLNAIANQLRYPNAFTHYFSCALLYLFAESNTEAIQEQITRVLLERLIVNRPHPWGLLITFIELIKNPAFKFWSHDFVRCAPEIEKLFESVAKSCMQTSANAKQAPPDGNPALTQA